MLCFFLSQHLSFVYLILVQFCSPKMPPKWPPGAPKIIPRSFKLTRGGPESAQEHPRSIQERPGAQHVKKMLQNSIQKQPPNRKNQLQNVRIYTKHEQRNRTDKHGHNNNNSQANKQTGKLTTIHAKSGQRNIRHKRTRTKKNKLTTKQTHKQQ